MTQTATTLRPNSLAARDVAAVLHPYTNLHAHLTDGPMVIAGGEGVYVFDDNGKRYLEGLAGLWCAGLGFSEPRLAEAAMRQFQTLPFYHSFASKSHEPGIQLAEELLKLAPVPMSKVFFANSGSEANDTAVKIAWYYNNALGRPQKKKIISRVKAYHGVTIVAASLTGLPNNHRDFDLPVDRILHTDCPHHYRFGLPGEDEEAFATRMAAQLEALIEREGPDTIAAMFAEPIQGAGGVILPPASYFAKIQPILKKHDILLIADEVICGFGRTGKMFGSETFGLAPDILTCAKQLSSGYLPISALMVNEKVFRALVDQSAKIGVFGHGFTYSAHPVAAAVALETLKIYEERQLLDHVQAIAPRLQQGLRRFADHPLVGEVRGTGLIAGVELVKHKDSHESFDPKAMVGARLTRFAAERGLLVRAMVDTIGFCPPLIITEAEIDSLLAIFGAALDETHSWAKQEGLVD